MKSESDKLDNCVWFKKKKKIETERIKNTLKLREDLYRLIYKN